MSHAVTSVQYETDPDRLPKIKAAHEAAVAALQQPDVGFVDGHLYEMMYAKGAYFHIWRWKDQAAAERDAELRATVQAVTTYMLLIASEPVYTEGVCLDD